ncbi:hypothetical protein G7046_g60 [Stylonectria norvegica]|nr:hypothetical protein G7046_g60 [Stylonectria norvegica]
MASAIPSSTAVDSPPKDSVIASKEDERINTPSPSPTLFDEKDEVKETVPPKAGGPDDVEFEYIMGWKLVSLMLSITLAAFLMLLDMSIIVTAIPKITTHFHSLEDIGWYGSSYNLASAALQPLSGKLYTYFSSKRIFLGFFFVFELGSLICGVAQSSTMLIIGRAVAGLGSSGIQNGAFTMIAASVPMEKRPSLMGLLMAGAQLGLLLGPLVGGALTEYSTWRWCFYINLPIGALCAILILLVHIPDRREHHDESAIKILTTKLDLTGFCIFAPCTIMFLLALQWGGNDYPWKSATIIGLFLGGAGMLLVFLWWEHRVGAGAMIPLHIVRQREIWTACLTMLFLFTTVFVASYYLPVYFQSVKGVSAFTSGVNMLPGVLTQLFGAISSGFLAQKVGYYLPFAVASAVLSCVGNGLMSTLGPDASTAKWAGFQVLIGFARGIGIQMPIIAIQANSKPELVSIATAILVFSQTFGGAMFITFANVIFNARLKDELASRLPNVDTQSIIDAGATGLRQATSAANVPAVIAAYAKAVDATFYLAVGAAFAMFVFSWGIGWKDIRKKAPVKENDA